MASENEDESESGGCALGCAGLWALGFVGVVVYLVGSTLEVYFTVSEQVLNMGFGLFILLGVAAFLGLLGGTFIVGQKLRSRLRFIGSALLGLALLCLGSAVWVTQGSSDFRVEKQVPPGGGTVGPVEIPRDNMALHVSVKQNVDRAESRTFGRWSFVTVELLDEDKEYLISFGGEFWHYAGFTGHEYWREVDKEYRTALRVLTAGTYYIRLKTETNVDTAELSPVRVVLEERGWWGTPIPLQGGGYVAFFFGLFLVFLSSRGPDLAFQLEEGVELRVREQAWTVREHVQYEYDDWKAEEWTLHPSRGGANKPRYLEREYEEESNWENWLLSRPVEVGTLQCTDADGVETDVARYTSTHEDLPDAVTFEGKRYTLEDSGTMRRDNASIPFHTYEGEKSGFVTIEEEPSDSLSVVAGESISTSEIEVEREPD